MVKLFISIILVISAAAGIFVDSLLSSKIVNAPPSSSVQEFSDSAYKIYFAKPGRGPERDGSIREIYSVNSDGTELKFEKNESTEVWQEETEQKGIQETMGEYIGDFMSPNDKSRLQTKSGYPDSWFSFYDDQPKLYVTYNKKKTFLLKGGFMEIEWLPDSRRIVFADSDHLGILDTQTGQYGYISEGAHMIKIERNSQ